MNNGKRRSSMFSLTKRMTGLMLGISLVCASAVSAAGPAPGLSIGLSDQAVEGFTITESAPGALTDGGYLVLELPKGVYFAEKPQVEVVNGNVEIKDIRTAANDHAVILDIDGESTKPSSLRVSHIKLKIDRTVAEGDILLEVKGTAVDEISDPVNWASNDAVATFNIGRVITPAPSQEKATETTFMMGSNLYLSDGEEKSMDTIPYIKEGRVYLPVRFVAEALGITENNITWDPATQTVTLMKNDRVVQMKVGSPTITVNGVSIPMDNEAEMKQGRVMLPLRGLAEAMGASASWDEDTRTVTIE